MIRIICNSSPIIGKLNLLWEIFDKVIIPKEVYREVVEANLYNNYESKELEKAEELD